MACSPKTYYSEYQNTNNEIADTTGSLSLTAKLSGNFYINDILREYVSIGTYTYADIEPVSHTAKITSNGQTLWQADFTIYDGNTATLTTKSTRLDFEPEMVFIHSGTFRMGSNDGDDDEKPVHSVTHSDYYIGKYEVTQAQWKAVMGDNPSWFKNCDNCPVEKVSWDDVQKYIKKLNKLTGKHYHLPTEAEWEYAARGGQYYKYAGSDNIDKVAWYDNNSGDKTHPVGQKSHNGYGLYDMSGNVWEWCSDRYSDDYYTNSPRNNPKGPSSGDLRVVRGGSWYNYDYICSVFNRNGDNQVDRDDGIGFRLARY